MNNQSGTERWEDFVLDEFLPHVQETFRVQTDRDGTLLTGISMGGKGSLLLGFKHAERFVALAALEPAIVPGLTWGEVKPKHLFFYPPESLGQLHGSPVDSEHWAANNPASIVHSDPDGICQGRSKIRPPWRRKTRPSGRGVVWLKAAVRRRGQDAGAAAGGRAFWLCSRR